MSYSINQYTGDGSNRSFPVTFPYIDKSHIEVRVNGVLKVFTTDYVWLNASTIQLVVAPAIAIVVDLRRNTPKTVPMVNFQDASVLTASDMNTITNQEFYIAQETLDAALNSISLTSFGVFDANSKRIANVADPVNAQDAVTKIWAETTVTSQISTATGAAATATAAAVAAAASAVTAASYSGGILGSTNVWTGPNTFNVSPIVPTATAGDSSTKAASTAFVAAAVGAVLPSQATNAGKYLKTDGTAATWQTVPTPSGSVIASGYTMSTAKVLGRITAATGAPEEVGIGAGLTMSAGTLYNSGVTTLNGLTGGVTAAQIASAATAGYGYTPVNGASYVLKDFGVGNYPIGTIISTPLINTPGTPVGSAVANPIRASYDGSTVYETLPGTWRNISQTAIVNYGPSYNACIQRIA